MFFVLYLTADSIILVACISPNIIVSETACYTTVTVIAESSICCVVLWSWSCCSCSLYVRDLLGGSQQKCLFTVLFRVSNSRSWASRLSLTSCRTCLAKCKAPMCASATTAVSSSPSMRPSRTLPGWAVRQCQCDSSSSAQQGWPVPEF